MSEYWEDFGRVSDAAYDALRRGTLVDRARSRPLCQFLILPSFENAVSWDAIQVVSRSQGLQTRLHRSCWRQDIDSQAFSSPVERNKHPRPYLPTLETGWTVIDGGALKSILILFNDVRIPLTRTMEYAGCDGTSFELAVGDYFCHARIGWWCDLPVEWQSLAPIVTEIERMFESAWERRHETSLQ